jgi:3-phosphoshikimate 1-carboxyvinyltransferase
MRQIKCTGTINATVCVPGSKSYSHRTAIAAALSNNKCYIYNYLNSQDTSYTLSALQKLGIKINHADDAIEITGRAGGFNPGPISIYLGNSGTSMRLLAAVSALGPGPYRLSGTDRMHERPIGELISALEQIGIQAFSENKNNCPPIEIRSGTKITGKKTEIDCSVSSQYLSGLLLMAPCTKNGLEIIVTKGPVSRPYVDMTLDIMSKFGIQHERQGFSRFWVPGGQCYASGTYTVEPDCSQAGYFWAAAAVTCGRVKVLGTTRNTRQGDIGLVDILAQMGCTVSEEKDGITVEGGSLRAVDADMGDMPDMVPTLAVVASFASGTTNIYNAAHLRAKESDRLAAVAAELSKMGVNARVTEDGLEIKGPPVRGAKISTYDDHRIAMSFAVAGLAVPGITIANPQCVEKSFPSFWEVFEELKSGS